MVLFSVLFFFFLPCSFSCSPFLDGIDGGARRISHFSQGGAEALAGAATLSESEGEGEAPIVEIRWIDGFNSKVPTAS